ncbi:phosphomannomutase/phosphoglucomutase [Vagococcus elongatus]|uniref:Phosphomannomutase/phosphoglucomutase n=1 Tax=Vagococcus elongatus TaxID=180344 RepID=A0A430ALC4_9ENTE|nr:phosphomannomutase/phosphoglucomutase [Vagococcus elongatus]RSU08908.1 phosphomannomutase/phosphoglucomutase [Vagococcus elongatus]
MSLKDLINGSDIRGISITTKDEEANLTPLEAKKIGVGVLHWLKEKKNVDLSAATIAVGQDSRLSGAGLKESLIETFVAHGVDVIDTGLSTTPAMFMATQFDSFDSDASIMITASHLPYYFNGLKFFTKDGGAEHEDITFILDYGTQAFPQSSKTGTVIKKDLITEYAQDLVTKIRQGIGDGEEFPLKDFHIIVDAGNGAGGFFAEKVLGALGAKTEGSQFLTPDGTFPNHMPNPDNKEAMASIQQAVLANGADLGVIFDTDVDRAAVVTKDGSALNRNNLIAALAQIVLREHPGTSIVTNSPTSSHLKDFIELLGGKQVRYLSGYRNVINKAIELNKQGIQTELAIETSGHAAFKENYFLDDGAYVVAKILMLLPKLSEEGRSLNDLIADLKQPAETQEVRFRINDENYRQKGMEVIDVMADFIEKIPDWSIDPENEEGIRANLRGEDGSGWFLLRMSLHEPLLVLQVENDVAGKNIGVFEKLKEFFEVFPELDLDALLDVLK